MTTRTRTAAWLPKAGAAVPDLALPSTLGELRLRGWAQGGWTLLFDHAEAGTPDCAAELGLWSGHAAALEARGVRVLGLSEPESLTRLMFQADLVAPPGGPVEPVPLAAAKGGLGGRNGRRRMVLIGPDLRVRLVSELPLRRDGALAWILATVEAVRAAERARGGTKRRLLEGAGRLAAALLRPIWPSGALAAAARVLAPVVASARGPRAA